MALSFRDLVDRAYQKRLAGQNLDFSDLMLILADTILDQTFFQSKHWRWQYGGVRYDPRVISSESPEKILVIQWPAAVGDAAMAFFFYASLRERYPAAHIHLLGNHTTKEIYHQSGLIDVFLENPLDRFLTQGELSGSVDIKALMNAMTEFIKALAGERFDLLFNLQVLPMTAALAKLSFARECIGMTLSDDGMPVIYGNMWVPYLFGVSANLMRSYNCLHRTGMLRKIIDPAAAAGINPGSFISRNSVRVVQSYYDEKGIRDQDTLVGVCPMSNSTLKTWKRYDELMKSVVKKYGVKIIVFGSPDEDKAVAEIVERSGVPAIKATHFDINELMAAISGCDLFITNDTGPMHLASLLDRRVIALFGPTVIGEVGPWSKEYVVLQSTQCKECFKTSCDVQPSCMDQISVEDVMRAVDYFLSGDKGALRGVSSGLTWWPPSTDGRNGNSPDELISQKYLRFFENHGDSPAHTSDRSLGKVALSKNEKMLAEFCSVFCEKVVKALKLLETEGDLESFKQAHEEISARCAFLKNMIVLNDMKFLDKRFSYHQDVESYKRFYMGVLKDVETFLSLKP